MTSRVDEGGGLTVHTPVGYNILLGNTVSVGWRGLIGMSIKSSIGSDR